MMTFLEGKKTYLVAIASIIWAGLGWIQGWLDPIQAQEMIFAALGAMGLRAGIAKVQ